MMTTVAVTGRRQGTLRASVRDGMAHAAMLGAGEAYYGAYGIFLKATTIQIGILATLPQLVGAFAQWAGAVAMDRLESRRKVIVTGAFLQAFVWLPVAVLPFLLGRNPSAAGVLIGLVVLSQTAVGFVAPMWNSLIGDLVPADIRGRYFGRRNRLTGLSTFVALLAGGAVLDVFERSGRAALGFLTIFLFSGLARGDSARWIARYEDPGFRIDPEQRFSFLQFLRRAPFSNFARFVFFFAALNFGVAFSAPYFALYMLRDLRFSYLEFTFVTAVATIVQFLTFSYWGGLSDRFGNKKILNLCGWGVGIVPLLWLASHDLWYLVAIQSFSGVVWAGFNLASANFMFDAVTPPKRARCAAYQALVNATFVFSGSLLGGFVATRLPHVLTLGGLTWRPVSHLLVIFLLSGVLRFIAAALFLHRFREVRPVEEIRDHELLFRISHLKPISGASFAVLTDMFRDRRREPRIRP